MEELTSVANGQEWDESIRQWHCLVLRGANLGEGSYRRVGVGYIKPGRISQSNLGYWNWKWSSDERRSELDKWRFELENWESELGKWTTETIIIV